MIFDCRRKNFPTDGAFPMINIPFNLNDQIIDKLNDLIRVNIDSCKGFKEASEIVDDEQISAEFRGLAQQRLANAEELKRYVEFDDEMAQSSGSASGAVHRWWMELRSRATGGDPSVVLSEAERGEDVITHEYQDALNETAGSPVNEILLRQYIAVKKGHDHVKALRDAAKADRR